MPDALAALGRVALAQAALPLAAWTVAALLVELALRMGRVHAAVSLPVRRASLWELPLGLAVAWLVGALRVSSASEAVVAVAGVRTVLLPEVAVGAGQAASAPPGGLVFLGLAVVVAGLAGLVALARLVRSVGQLAHVRLPPAGPAVDAVARRALAEAGVARAVRVVASPAGTVPFTFGHRRPTLAVPEGLAGDALDLALAHEAAHIRAGDFAASLADRAAAAVFAAHPLAHVLVRGIEHNREQIADAAVLARHAPRRRAYADLLVSFAARPAPRLALGAVPGSFSLLDRLTVMTRPPLSTSRLARLRRSGRLSAAALGLAVVALAGWTSIRASVSDRSFQLVDPVVRVSGSVVIESGMRITQMPFRFLFVHVPDVGRFVVSDQPFEIGSAGGAFEGSTLRIPADGDRPALDIQAAQPLFVGPEAPRGSVPAYVWFGPAALGPAELRQSRSVSVGVSSSVPEALGLAEAARARMAAARSAMPSGDPIFEVVEEPPVLIGGLDALMERLVYPEDAFREGRSGTTVAQFVVGADGRTRDIRILRSAGDARLDSAAVEAIRGSTFQPGRQSGQPVAVRFALPVRFAAGGE